MEKIIWILDDDMVSQFAITYVLEQCLPDLKVVSFYSPIEALEALDKCSKTQNGFPNKMIVDLAMPTQSGWWFLDELEKVPEILEKIDVYIVSAFTNSKDRGLAEINPIIKGFFDKPISKTSIERVFR